MKFVFSKALCPEAMDIVDKVADIYVADDGNPNNYLDELKDADAYVLRIGKMDAHAIVASPSLKVIGRTGVGYDNVDMKAATQAGIAVITTPGANTRSVAEHAVALLMAVSKNLVEGQIETAKGNFTAIRDAGKTFEIQGKSIGVVGFGAIGRETAKICHALGMNVLAYDPYINQEKAEEYGCEYYDNLEDLLKACDIVTLHVPLVENTRGMIGEKQLAMMKKTAVLINCSRGGIIDEKALIDALNCGIIAGAGIDVFEKEPPQIGDAVLTAKNVIYSPHSAATTREAIMKMSMMCAEGCLEVLRGQKWPHVVNPEAFSHPRWKEDS
jgi:D-3-phosphoglycerate dehydrogenase